MPKTKPHKPSGTLESTESMLKVMLDACGDAIEENLPDCGFIVILATTDGGLESGTMRYLSNLTKQSRDHLLEVILSGEEPPVPNVPPSPTVQ